METRTSFTQAHLENKLWLNELDFYREETGIYLSHLEALVARSTSLQESEQVGYLRNQFARFRDQINRLELDLTEAEKKMAMYARSHDAVDLDTVNVGDHAAFREQYADFREGFLKLKQTFRNFETAL